MHNIQELKKGFSIVIPSWNNFEYLNFCIKSIRKTSYYDHEIIVHLNEWNNSTKEYEILRNYGCKITTSNTNLGVAKPVNIASKLSTKDYIMYFNDDMVALLGWDIEILKFIADNKIPKLSFISSTLIEPFSNKPEMISPCNYGKHPSVFQYNKIMSDIDTLKNRNKSINGTTWPPHLIHKDVWEEIGGFSEEFFPGFGTDPDIAKKLWDIGCRTFVSVGRSVIYHFQTITTTKIRDHGDSKAMFKAKHSIAVKDFVYNYLKRGTEYKGPLEDVNTHN